MMNESDIRKYAGLMKELDLTGLEITEGDKVVRLERALSAAPAVHAAAADAIPSEKSDHADYISVKSPIVGVFYAAPAENAEPFVSLGERVEKGKTLCIIEAMKLMNEICAEEGGEVCEICVTNGQIVDYGTELFKLRR
jgi:acetyl-CoA carboxylase biotin carboxyl carrier protein